MSRSNYGLVRAEQIDLYGEIDRMIAGPPVHVAIIMLGVNDRASIRVGAGRAQPGAAEWKEAYAKEAEKLIKKLKGANIAVYWVGLPVMGNPAFSESAAQMNDAVRQAAYVNGVKFIETWAGFTDQLGNYSAYGPDLTGQTKRLREGDGIGLTAPGIPETGQLHGNRACAATLRTPRLKGIFRLPATRRSKRAWSRTGRITLRLQRATAGPANVRQHPRRARTKPTERLESLPPAPMRPISRLKP